jgi:hypothetical protein
MTTTSAVSPASWSLGLFQGSSPKRYILRRGCQVENHNPTSSLNLNFETLTVLFDSPKFGSASRNLHASIMRFSGRPCRKFLVSGSIFKNKYIILFAQLH